MVVPTKNKTSFSLCEKNLKGWIVEFSTMEKYFSFTTSLELKKNENYGESDFYESWFSLPQRIYKHYS